MSTARDIILEIKRRISHTGTPEPDEVDLLAYVNSVLLAFWNYACREKSVKITKIEHFTSDSGTVPVEDGIMVCLSVKDNSSGRYLRPAVPADAFGRQEATPEDRVYLAEDYQLRIFPEEIPADIDAAYIPMFTKITDRSQEMPFSPALDNYIISFAIRMLINGEDPEIMLAGLSMSGNNPMSKYFRRKICGQGPW